MSIRNFAKFAIKFVYGRNFSYIMAYYAIKFNFIEIRALSVKSPCFNGFEDFT